MKTNSRSQFEQKETEGTELFRYHRLASVASVSSCLILLLFAVTADATTRYVWQESPSPAPPHYSPMTPPVHCHHAVDNSRNPT